MPHSLELESPQHPALPPIHRSSMVYRVPSTRPAPPAWTAAAVIRRAVLAVLVISSGFWGGGALDFVLAQNQALAFKTPVVILFSVLFGWISFSFWVALCGFALLFFRRDRFSVSAAPLPAGPIPPSVHTCLVMPIYNEDTARVFANLRSMVHSLRRTGQRERFDIFVLSDTTRPELFAAEETAWSALCQELGDARIFYRRRMRRVQKKSGNIADFCRRWGRDYRYMIVLDADSLVTGELAVRMVRRMEQRPDIGILQTVPRSVNQSTLLARIQQFAGQLYGPLYIAGFHFWQLGDGGFWGHNAVIRLEPFMRYAGLPKLSGPPPFGGDILSHDFIEAALLRRAGYGIWLDYRAEGSYEQPPSNLLEELSRDRRWCQGNVQHLRFLFMRGISFGHRLLFLIGNWAYLSSALLFLFLFFATASIIAGEFHAPDYFPTEHALFPRWPVYHAGLSSVLMALTALFLFVPKFLGLAVLIRDGRHRLFGGAARILVGLVLESVCSILLAPARMVFHTQFVLMAVTGSRVDWCPVSRSGKETGWLEAMKTLGPATLMALGWAAMVFLTNREFLGWLGLFLGPLAFSIPLAVAFSRVRWGMAARRRGLFLIPEESCPPRELRGFQDEGAVQAPFFSRTTL